jgi:hypothetical protein
MISYWLSNVPSDGDRVTHSEGHLDVSDNPMIPVFEGDGGRPDIGAHLVGASKSRLDGTERITKE